MLIESNFKLNPLTLSLIFLIAIISTTDILRNVFATNSKESVATQSQTLRNEAALATSGPLQRFDNISRSTYKVSLSMDSYESRLDRSSSQDAHFNQSISTRRGHERGDEAEYRDGDTRVPFWNIAHMINSIEQIEPALASGANGIEVDISFDTHGNPVDTYHGFPCDCGRHCHYRENFIKFVKHLAKISTGEHNNNLLLVVFDLKLKDLSVLQKEVAGKQLAVILEEHLYRKYPRKSSNSIARTPLRVVISINHVTDNILIRSFMRRIHENRLDFITHQVGFDVGMNDNLTDILAMWDHMPGLTFNIWQGDGLTNCANLIRGVERLKEAIRIRNAQGHFRKIYYWTADMMYQIRTILRFGLDAVLTNQPQRVIQILEEPEFKVNYRLATPYDNPFTQFWIKPLAWKLSPPSLSEAIETVTNIRETGENFIKTLPNGIAAAIQKVQHSIIHKRQ